MRYAGFGILTLAMTAFCGDASANMSRDKQQLAGGLAQIIAYAEPCGYELDQATLEQYVVDQGLSDPEALQFIRTDVTLMEKSNQSLCTITKATAKSLGLLK